MGIRRGSWQWATVGVLASAVPLTPVATAQPATYPTKSLRVIASQSAGGGVDAVARLVAARLAEATWSLARPGAEPPLTRYAVAAFARPFTLDTTRLREELGVTGEVDVDAEIERVAANLRAHGAPPS